MFTLLAFKTPTYSDISPVGWKKKTEFGSFLTKLSGKPVHIRGKYMVYFALDCDLTSSMVEIKRFCRALGVNVHSFTTFDLPQK